MAVVTASYPYGPGEAFLGPELAALASLGVQVDVVPLLPRGGRRPDAIADARIEMSEQGLATPGVLTGALGVLVGSPLRSARAIAAASGGPARIRVKNLAVMAKGMWLARHLQATRADHVHAHWGGTTSTAAMIAARVTGLPWSMTCHRWDVFEDNLLGEKGASARFVRFISRQGMEAGVARGVPPERARVVHLGAELPTTAGPPPWLPAPEPFRVLCAANLLPVKGHAHLVDALARIPAGGRPLRLELAGEGPLRGEIEERARRIGVADRIDFLGQLAHADVLSRLSSGRIHLAVLASLDLGHGEHEGIPVSLVEAMVRGVPVVATRTGAIPELLPESSGLTVPGGDAPALARLVARMRDDPAFHAEASAWCVERARSGWDSRRSARTLLDLVEAGPGPAGGEGRP